MPWFFNSDVVMGVVQPVESMPADLFYRNGEADEIGERGPEAFPD